MSSAAHRPTPLTESILMRPAHPDDLPLVQDLHARCSLDARFARYGRAVAQLSPAQWAHLTNPERSLTYLVSTDDAPQRVIAMVNAVSHLGLGIPTAYDLGVLVADDFCGQGLGEATVRRIAGAAQQRGAVYLTATVGARNQRMLNLLGRLGAVRERHTSLVEAVLALPLPNPTLTSATAPPAPRAETGALANLPARPTPSLAADTAHQREAS